MVCGICIQTFTVELRLCVHVHLTFTVELRLCVHVHLTFTVELRLCVHVHLTFTVELRHFLVVVDFETFLPFVTTQACAIIHTYHTCIFIACCNFTLHNVLVCDTVKKG